MPTDGPDLELSVFGVETAPVPQLRALPFVQ
jgi:hypothetical protein